MDTLYDYMMKRPATVARPLLGLTLLLVEDSRFASEAMRLLCIRSGARIRRADSLLAARRHLRVYRPGAIIIDLGLPDGSGADLIAELAEANPRVDVILGMSGDPDAEPRAMAAGADGFLAKPVTRMGQFQTAILHHLPRERQPPGPRPVSEDTVIPDTVAYHDDLAHVQTVLQSAPDLDYVTQFLGGVARSAGDKPMSDAVAALAASQSAGQPSALPLATISALVQSRLSHAGPL
jgi:two-component system, OmpR family, response regulator